MDIKKNLTENNLNVALIGRLDTTTAPQLEEIVKNELDSVDNLTYDFEKLEYISSAGLRVLLASQKAINAKSGTMKIKNVCSDILEVFEITGFSDILTIE